MASRGIAELKDPDQRTAFLTTMLARYNVCVWNGRDTQLRSTSTCRNKESLTRLNKDLFALDESGLVRKIDTLECNYSIRLEGSWGAWSASLAFRLSA